MNNMDYEQKYKEALERAKEFYILCKKCGAKDTVDFLEDTFTELKESEDEKNIKDLIDELKCSLRAANCQNDVCRGGHEKRIALLEWAIAWLEKQGKKPPVLSNSLNIGKDEWNSEDEKIRKSLMWFVERFPYERLENDGVSTNEALAWLERQGKQNSAKWHNEDEQNLNSCLGYISDEFLRRWLKNVVHVKYDKPIDKVEQYNPYEATIRSIAEMCGRYSNGSDLKDFYNNIKVKCKEAIEFEQKSVKWTEEDEKCIDNCCLLIGAADDCYEKTFKDDCIHYLQSLKERIAWKLKWTDEDEEIALSIEQVMNCASLLNIVPEKIDKIRTWLKSLKQRMEG